MELEIAETISFDFQRHCSEAAISSVAGIEAQHFEFTGILTEMSRENGAGDAIKVPWRRSGAYVAKMTM